MLFLKRLFQAPRFEAEARARYRQIAERARRPVLFTVYGVPDTIDGRFEMLCLHAYALFHGLKGKGADAEAFSQAVYDAMFADLDGSLRELGAADLGVGKRIKAMTEALRSHRPGDTVEIVVRRGAGVTTLRARLGTRGG